MTMTWLVWSPTPPECLEKVSCSSMQDAARAWAERLLRRGVLPRDGMEVLARVENDPMPRLSTYRIRISMVNAPSFRATLVGLAHEGNGASTTGGSRG